MKKIISILLAFTMIFCVAAMAVSCGETEKDKGKVLVSYDGGAVYESDVEDWINYYILSQYSDRVAEAEDEGTEINSIADEAALRYAVNMMVAQRLTELNLYERNQASIDALAQSIIDSCELQYADDGGYEYFKESLQVSDDFVYSMAEFNLILAALQSYIEITDPITDDDINEYWEAYAYNYMTPPSVYYDVIFFDIPDESYEDETAWEAAKSEAESYIAKINAGEISFDDAKTEVVAKYSAYGKTSEYYSQKTSVETSEIAGFENESCIQENIDAFFATAKETFTDTEFKKYVKIDAGTNEAQYWFLYAQMINEIYTKYALNSAVDGEIFGEAVMHPDGYMIIKRISATELPTWDRPENNEQLKTEIENALWDERWGDGDGTAANKFYNEVISLYNANIEFSYLENYQEIMGDDE